MPMNCYDKRDSNEHVCGKHNVPLTRDLIAIDANAPWLGRIACFLCPVGRVVVEVAKG